MAPEKKKPGRGRGRPPKHADSTDESGRTGTPLSLRIDPELMGKMPALIAEYKRIEGVKLHKTDVVEMALTLLYRKYGILPPADADAAK